MFCTNCGKEIDSAAVVCVHCGCATQNFNGNQQQQQRGAPMPPPPVIIQNTNVVGGGRQRDKWVAFLLCFFLGVFGVHKFYEGKVGMGLLYLFTGGLCGIGYIIDLILILCKPNPYYV